MKWQVVWQVYSQLPNRGGDHTLSKMPQDYLEGCCGGYAGQTRAQNERTDHAVSKMDFGIRFLSKACIFWSRIFLRGSIWRGQRGGIKNPLNLICSTVIQIPRNEFIA